MEVEKLLAELIARPSVNPAFLPGEGSKTGEGRVAEFLADLAKKAGLEWEWQAVLPGRKNLLVKLSPQGKKRRRVVLAPHLDTIGGTEITEELFRPRQEGDRLHGRGACDTKGSVAAMFHALLKIAAAGPRPNETEILFVGLADEENAQEGSRAFAKSRIKGDLAIVGEPTELKVVTAHKGDLWLKLITQGKAAHGSRPELGENAVLEMAKAVQFLEQDYSRKLKKRRHPLLGSPTINVGAIRGGRQPNVVPDYCEILVDRRTIPGEKDRAVEREIIETLKEAGIKTRLVNTKEKACPAMETDTGLPLVQKLMALCKQNRALGVDFFCDAAILAGGGIPSVVFGPGNIAQAHTADEWISIRSLESAGAILKLFLEGLE